MKRQSVAMPEPRWADLYDRMREGNDAAEIALLRAVVQGTPSISAAARALRLSRYALMRSLTRLGLRKAGNQSAPPATVAP